MNHKWNFDAVWDNPEALLAGAVGTLRIFVICLVLGLSLGLLVGLGRYARRQWIYIPVSIFVEFFATHRCWCKSCGFISPFRFSCRSR